jgi:hypothetical protein
MIPETLALLNLWTPEMSVAELKDLALRDGVIGRATALRVQDIVGRVFAPRYLCDDGRPAVQLKQLLSLGADPRTLNAAFLIHTARAHAVLHDFIREVYWPMYRSGSRSVSRSDSLAFLDRAMNLGRISPRWSAVMTQRTARNLTGCLEDFEMVGPDRAGAREILDFPMDRFAVLYLAHDIHFSGFSDTALVEHEDWGLFGLSVFEVRKALERVATGLLIPQFSGELVRITWNSGTMEEALRGIASTGF